MQNDEFQKQVDPPHVEPSEEMNTLKSFRRNIDLTRRSCMNAADRLTDQERFIQMVNIYYSCISATVSILCLIKSAQFLAIASTLLTVILAMSIIYLNAQKYEKRAQQFRTKFLSLYKLMFDVNIAIMENNFESFQTLYARYIELLGSGENCIDEDFIRVLILKDKIYKRKYPDYTPRVSRPEKMIHYTKIAIKMAIQMGLIIVPIVFFVFVYVKW